MIEINNRWNGRVIFRAEEARTLREALRVAIATGADLTDADLRGADLSGADLTDADLRGADLTGARLNGADLSGARLRSARLIGADLSGARLSGADLRDARLSGANLIGADLSVADLSGADLSGANLSSARLRGADLCDANLSDANLTGADLTDADLSGANLSGADLTDAHLSGADLRGVREDLRLVLDARPGEVVGLLAALHEGRVNGSTYEGPCACLVGTIANLAGCDHDDIPGLTPNPCRPAERWVLAICPGDTGQTNQVSALTIGWIEEWLRERGDGAV